MSNAAENFPLSHFSQATNESRIERYHGYWPMMARNTHTNRLEEVVLLEPSVLNDITAVESHPELVFDLRKALGKFTKTQRVVLHRVLVEGQSVDTATHRVRGPFTRTRRWWTNWITNVALPQLRKDLADYHVNGKVIL